MARPGSTRLELLVVIAITAVPIAPLLPAISTAPEAARRVHFVNNLKPFGITTDRASTERTTDGFVRRALGTVAGGVVVSGDAY